MVSAEFSVRLDKSRFHLSGLYHKIEMCCRREYQKALRDVSKSHALNLFVENKPSLYRVVFLKELLDTL
jgi:hypothetical protein